MSMGVVGKKAGGLGGGQTLSKGAIYIFFLDFWPKQGRRGVST